jgi:hypothetical protein
MIRLLRLFIFLTGLLVVLVGLVGLSSCASTSERKLSSVTDLKPLPINGTWNCEKSRSGLSGDFHQGFVEVPEDYNHPEGRKLKIFYYGQWESNSPLIIVNGGPGSSSWNTYVKISLDLMNIKLNIYFSINEGPAVHLRRLT